MNADLGKLAATIELLILDVDGVLTDGRLYFSANGDESKAFHVRDGYGIRKLQAAGVQVAIISGRQSAAKRVNACVANERKFDRLCDQTCHAG